MLRKTKILLTILLVGAGVGTTGVAVGLNWDEIVKKIKSYIPKNSKPGAPSSGGSATGGSGGAGTSGTGTSTTPTASSATTTSSR